MKLPCLPHQIKRSICISDFMQTTFFYLGRFLKKLADDQYSSITKGSIKHIKHMYIHHFTTVVNWPEIGCWMEVSTMFYICRYCDFTLWGRVYGMSLWRYIFRGDWYYSSSCKYNIVINCKYAKHWQFCVFYIYLFYSWIAFNTYPWLLQLRIFFFRK